MTAPLAISPATDGDVEALVDLWTRCNLTRPWNDPRADIAFARRSPTSDILVGRDGPHIVASAMVGHDGHRGWAYYVAVDPTSNRRGLGRAIMQAAEQWLRERGVVKLMLMVRPDNRDVCAFYDAIGYEKQERVVYAKWLDGRAATP